MAGALLHGQADPRGYRMTVMGTGPTTHAGRFGGEADGGVFSYDEAFARHRGLINLEEQEKLRRSRVAIVGMGGVGGVHLATLSRLGIGGFNIADPDRFEVANINRQYGAKISTLGRGKAEVMAEESAGINPEVDIRVISEPIDADNVGRFLDGVDLLVDGIDFFALDVRRLIFREARRRGIWALTAGPIGFSAAWIVFDPAGMSFDEYFDINDGMDRMSQLVAFLAGLTPRATHLPYMDLRQVDTSSGRGPSAGLACHLCSGVAGAEAVKILLGRRPIKAAPWFSQFDAYRGRLATGRLRGGNRHPFQRLKRHIMRKRLIALGWGGGPGR
jgi:molybdopterin/thiamine biosynthesis adenylyltransferase